MADDKEVLYVVTGTNGKTCLISAPNEERAKKQAIHEFGENGIVSMTPVNSVEEGLRELDKH